MPRGRQPEGEYTLSNAERQARYRGRQQAKQPPSKVRYRQQPDNLRDNPTGEALEIIVDLDLDALAAIVPPRGYGRD
jgi:hypothetical protein